MRNLSLGINAILIIAVGVLYYLFLKKPAVAETTENGAVKTVVPVASNIVYVNSDSLLEHYSYFKNKKEEFDKKSEQIKAQLKNESDRLQQEAQGYQQRAAGMTSEERAKTEEGLMMKQEGLMKKKDQLYADLESQQEKFHQDLYDNLMSFFRDYNKDHNYSFILGYTKGGGILFANDSLDITRQAIEGLNKTVAK